MTDPEHGTPLHPTDARGVSDGLRVKGDYDPKLALTRDGQVNVDLKKKAAIRKNSRSNSSTGDYSGGSPPSSI